MEYNVTQESSVKTKVDVTVPAEECNAALTAAVAIYRAQADIKGFRKGKAPSSVIEGRFRKQITSEATNDLLNVHINEILAETKAAPLSRVDVDAGEIVRDADFTYSFSYEHAPQFELPQYSGLEVEEEAVEVKEEDVQAVIDRIRGNLADLKAVTEDRLPQDGDVVVVSFEGFENGEPTPGVGAENFQLNLGEGQALPEFEELVKSVKAGADGEGEMTFPDDFINPGLAGRTVTMKITVHVIKEKILPEMDDELAVKAGNFENMEKMREAIAKSYETSRSQLHRSAAQKALIDQLLETVDFDLPDSVVEAHLERMAQEEVEKVERMGKNLEALGKTMDGLKKELEPGARELVKSQILLQAVAGEEGLEVSPQEMDGYFNYMASQSGQDVITLKQYYEANNMVSAVRDKLLADKAIDLIYNQADVKKTAPKTEGEDGTAEDKPEDTAEAGAEAGAEGTENA